MSSEKLSQNWKITIGNQDPKYPFVLIDDWYTPEEEKSVWKELDFYSALDVDKIQRAENTTVAREPNGDSKSKAYRFYLDDFYNRQFRHLSPIINCMYKQRTPEFQKILLDNCMPYARSFPTSNSDNTMISYYEEKDHYRPHHDTMLWTCLIWMVREPKQFEGGDFKLNDIDVEIKLRNNRMVIFPCCYLHEVTPLKFNTPPKELGHGKYTITHFYIGA